MFTVVACSYLNTQAQNGFEINSILVDACGSPEGENEMVRFTVGASPLQVSSLNVTWPNTSLNFLGIWNDKGHCYSAFNAPDDFCASGRK